MAEPRLRFKREDGTAYPELRKATMGDFYTERNERGSEGLPMLTVSIHSGVSDGELDEEELGKRVKRSADPAMYKKAVSGDMVFNMMRAWQGAVGCVKTTGMVSPAYIVAEPNGEIDPTFMDYYVQTKTIIDRFNRLSYGALDFRKRLYWDSFVTTEVNIPDLEEQLRIAGLLTEIDAVIVACEEEVVKQERQKQAAMQKIFSQGVRFKREDGSEFPMWEEKKLADVFEEISEKNHPELPVLSVAQGVGTIFREESDRRIRYDKNNLSGYKVIRKGDYIIHLRSFEGGLECSNHDGISSPAYRILRSSSLLPDVFKHYFRSIDFIKNKLAVSVVGIRDGKNIDMNTFYEIQIGIPCIEEQRLIADFLSAFDDAISAAKQELEHWKKLKQGLLQQMFA